jgi:hypothetical protein
MMNLDKFKILTNKLILKELDYNFYIGIFWLTSYMYIN